MDTGILVTFVTLLLMKLNIYPAVRGEHGVDLVGSCPNFRLFLNVHVNSYMYMGRVESFQNCHIQITTLLLKAKGWISQGYTVSCLWRKLKKVEVCW